MDHDLPSQRPTSTTARPGRLVMCGVVVGRARVGGAMLLGGRRGWAEDAWARLSLGPPRGLQSSFLVSHSFIPRACPHPRPCPSVDFLRHGLLFVIPRTLTTSSILRNDCHISSRPSLSLPSALSVPTPAFDPSPSVPPASSLVHRSTASTALTHFFSSFSSFSLLIYRSRCELSFINICICPSLPMGKLHDIGAR